MGSSKIPEEEWNLIKKYSLKEIQNRFLLEESLPKQSADRFISSLFLINMFVLVIIYLFNITKQYNIVLFMLFPSILVASVIVLGYLYGKSPQYQLTSLIINLVGFLIIQYLILYYTIENLSVSDIPSLFILQMIFGIMVGLMLGFILRFNVLSKDVVIGNPLNFEVEVLSHNENIEKFEDVLIKSMQTVMPFNKLSEYISDDGNILKKISVFKNIFLLYIIKEKCIYFLIFSKSGKYIIQDEVSINSQKEISFLLKNSFGFKKVDNDNIKEDASNSCINILKQYTEPSNIGVIIEKHKTESIFLIILIILMVLYPLYSSYIPSALEYVKNFILPIIILVVLEYYLRKNK